MLVQIDYIQQTFIIDFVDNDIVINQVDGVNIYDEGAFVGSVRAIDFIGSAVSVVKNGTRAEVTISGTGGSGSGVDSFNGRTGAVSPLQADYDGFFLTPTEGDAAYQPLDSDLTAIAALSTQAFGRSLLEQASAAAARTTLEVVAAFQSNVKGTTLNRLVGAYVNNTNTGTVAAVADRIRAIPRLLKHPATIDGIYMEVSTGTTGNVRMGVYADDGNGYPGALVSVVTQKTVSAPAVLVDTQVTPLALQPGLYHLVFITDTANTFRSISVGGQGTEYGYTVTMGSNNSGAYWTSNLVYTTLPATFPAGATMAVAVAYPLILWREI